MAKPFKNQQINLNENIFNYIYSKLIYLQYEYDHSF